jgi:hypothetical protein
MTARQMRVYVLNYSSHERSVFYWRFMGGFGGDSRHHKRNRQSVCSMQNMQRPYLLRTSAQF